MTLRIVPILVAGLFITGCTHEDGARPVGRPPAEASQETPEAAKGPREKDWSLERASSQNAVIGVATRFRLYTHCGVDWMVDFVGSFWDAIGEARAIDNGDYRKMGNPSDRGTMTLVAPDAARYVSDSGVTIDFARAAETRRISPCY